MGSERDRAIVFEAWRQYEDDSTVGAEAKARAIIAAVDAQHPAPAPPRDVAMRIADAVRFLGLEQMHSPPSDDDLAAIVSRHLPTDEEREAERAVVEAVVAEHAARRADESVRRCAEASLRTSEAVESLLAIRAKRGAR